MPMPKAMVATITSILPGQEFLLDALAVRGVESGVIGGGGKVAAELGGERVGLLARRSVDDGGAVGTRRAAESRTRSAALRGGDLDDFDGDVVAPEAVDEARGLGESELRGDVVLHDGRRGGGEGDHRRGAQRRKVVAEHAVVGAEVVAPLGNAMRLVDGDEGGFALGEHFGEAGDAQALGRDEEELQIAVEVVDAGLAGGGAVASGVDALHGEAARLEGGDLVFHQRDERADDERGASARDGGELVAERFAGAGGHDEKDVFAFDGGLADGFLVGAEGGEAEGPVEEVGEGFVGLGGEGAWARRLGRRVCGGARC